MVEQNSSVLLSLVWEPAHCDLLIPGPTDYHSVHSPSAALLPRVTEHAGVLADAVLLWKVRMAWKGNKHAGPAFQKSIFCFY